MRNDKDSYYCPCGSGNEFKDCCAYYFSILGIKSPLPKSDTLLLDWLEKYSIPIMQSFKEKIKKYIFRLSCYSDNIVDQYFTFGFFRPSSNQEEADNAIISIKNNILHSIFGSLTCLSQGLFLQSGTILRSMFEDSFVLVDLFENSEQIEKFLQNKYSVRGLVSRVKRFIPTDVISWYGYFSANFAHFGPLHPAPYLPRACYPDNWILVTGLQNIIRSIVTFHLILERLYFEQTDNPLFWKRYEVESDLVFDNESKVFDWAEKLGKEVVSNYPPNERKEGFLYNLKSYKTK